MRYKPQDVEEWHPYRIWNCWLFSVTCVDGTSVWGETVERRWSRDIGRTSLIDPYDHGMPIGGWEYRIPEAAT
jgi:hypothetical protein